MGQVERLNRTLQIEWAYRQIFYSNQDRHDALAPRLDALGFDGLESTLQDHLGDELD
jgi:hypothetical protein